MTRFITHFESAIDPSVSLPADCEQTMHENRPLWSRYDLEGVRGSMTKSALLERPRDMWRYRELLPIGDEIEPVSLNKSMSPVIECPTFAKQMGMQHVWIKDESQLPTCSFKCRGMSLATTMAKHFGQTRIAMASNGNAGGAMGMYAARAGMQCVCFMPHDTPIVNQTECYFSGAKLFVTNGLIDESGKRIREGHNHGLWFDISTLKEPYRLEGKKTMGLELAEQFNWELPDVILYPTGGGTALIAMWKAFEELREMGFLTSETMPRMYAIQSDGCQPMVTAFEAGERFAKRHENAHTIASGMRVPAALGDFMVLDTVRASGGAAISVEETRLIEWQKKVSSAEGIIICPEAATCIGGLEKLIEQNQVARDERVVIFNTAAGQKYFGKGDPLDVPSIDLSQATDWDAFEQDYLLK
ncbi:threonine synthase [Mariniblastus sp.]|nr:threonine synthase [Mariniblastus sp.]MDA7902743.1 threonine synthase [Mariniblastus sp.]MDB4473258.1 threonine synthase [bacterium]MDC3223462.1 threonine synthase [Mariniblastus sp.]